MKDYKTQIEESKERCRKLGLKREQVYSKKIVSDANLQKILVKNRNMIMTALPYIEAVSYTHLDVYKRQVLLWGGRRETPA